MGSNADKSIFSNSALRYSATNCPSQDNARRVRRAWSWPRNQCWFETLLNGNFVMFCVFAFCYNFFVDRNQTWKLSENLVSKT